MTASPASLTQNECSHTIHPNNNASHLRAGTPIQISIQHSGTLHSCSEVSSPRASWNRTVRPFDCCTGRLLCLYSCLLLLPSVLVALASRLSNARAVCRLMGTRSLNTCHSSPSVQGGVVCKPLALHERVHVVFQITQGMHSCTRNKGLQQRVAESHQRANIRKVRLVSWQ